MENKSQQQEIPDLFEEDKVKAALKKNPFKTACVFLQNPVEWQIMAMCQLFTSASSYKTTNFNTLWLQ